MTDVTETPHKPLDSARRLRDQLTEHLDAVQVSCELDSSTAIDLTEADTCPGCGVTYGVQPKLVPPKVQAWTCTACGTDWAVTVVHPLPQPFFDRLAATVEQLGAARSRLRQLCALADDAPMITDEQLRDRLLALAGRRLSCPHRFPPGGQPVPPSTRSTVKELIMARYVRPDIPRTSARRKPRRKPKSAGLVARSIAYRSTQRPHDRPQELTVSVPHGEVIDTGYAAAVVAVRTGMPLAEVTIVTISAPPSRKTGDQ